jgi:hypothetical protein
MKQEKFMFVDIVSAIFLLVILVANFLGLLYITEGNAIISLLISLFLVVCYFFVIKLLKANKEVMFKNKFVDKTMIFWGFFLFLSVSSFALITHLINVEYNTKSLIQKDVKTKIQIVNETFENYKKIAKVDIQDYQGNLKNKLRTYEVEGDTEVKNVLLSPPYSLSPSVFQNRNINESKITEAAMRPLESATEKNIAVLEKKIEPEQKELAVVFEDWQRFRLMSKYKDLNTYVANSVNAINQNVQKLPYSNAPLQVEVDDSQLPLNQPVELYEKFKPSLMIPSAVVLVTHLFILIPFFTKSVRGYGNSSYQDQNVREI